MTEITVSPPVLIVSDIFKRYTGASGEPVQVMKGFSWEAHAGEVTGLIGANGSGKTTMFQMIAGLLLPDDGLISVAGVNPVHNPHQARQICAWLPEHPGLAKTTTGRDILIEYGALGGLSKAEITTRLDRADRELGLSSFWTRRAGGYSRGQAVLISLARFGFLERQVWLLDEPTAGLDFENAGLVRQWMKSHAQEGKVVVVATHLLSDLKQIADKIVGLADGRKASNEKMNEWMGAWSSQDNKDPSSQSNKPQANKDVS